MAGAACVARTQLRVCMHACMDKACSAAGRSVSAPGTSYQCQLCVRKDWLRQFFSVACDASLTRQMCMMWPENTAPVHSVLSSEAVNGLHGWPLPITPREVAVPTEMTSCYNLCISRSRCCDVIMCPGAKKAEDGFEPTASLLTAMLVAGASSMTGLALRNGQPLSLYDVNQGFGLVDLSKTLPLSGVTNADYNIRVSRNRLSCNKTWTVWQKESFSDDGQSKIFKVTSNAQHPLTVSLAWLDLPGTPNTFPILTNDLDLKITSPSGSVTWGNQKVNGDRTNNIEKVGAEESGVFGL
eukprot:1155737-Pelagomonas_calceolata.AAC.2